MMLASRFGAAPKTVFRQGLATLLLGFALLHGQLAPAETGIVVVARKNSAVPQLSRDEVAGLFLGKRKFGDDVAIVPIDSKDGSLRERFYLAVADMNGLRVKAYWSRIVFSGQGRPPREASAAEIGALLSTEPGLVTYLPASQLTADMKIVFTVP
jgi:hypothetical protein